MIPLAAMGVRWLDVCLETTCQVPALFQAVSHDGFPNVNKPSWAQVRFELQGEGRESKDE